jgi:hypothetical protein
MKNKIIYVFLLIFSASLLSSAKKVQGNCNKLSACTQQEIKKCKQPAKNDADGEAEYNLPSLGLFFFNI